MFTWPRLFRRVPSYNVFSRFNLALVMGAEIPKKQWPDLVVNLQNNVSSGTLPGLKQATLAALGYVCEEVQAEARPGTV